MWLCTRRNLKRLPVGVALFAALFIAPLFAGGSVGATVQCVGAKCVAGASSSILSIVVGLILFVVLLLIPRHPFRPSDAHVGFWRMVGALVADSLLASTGFAALLAVPMLVAEASYTGDFAWRFGREFLRSTDWMLAILAVFGSYAVVIALRVGAHTSGKPSFGQYLLGYQVVNAEDRMDVRSALVRIGWATLYLVLWPVYLVYKFARKLDRDLWDVRCQARSVRFEYS